MHYVSVCAASNCTDALLTLTVGLNLVQMEHLQSHLAER